jgi:integrase
MTSLILTEDWVKFRSFVTPSQFSVNLQKAQLTVALSIIADVLMILYGKTDITKFCTQRPNPLIEVDIVNAVQTTIKTRDWKRRTGQNTLLCVKHILTLINVNARLIGAFRLLPLKTTHNQILGRVYGRLPVTDPVRLKLEEWIEVIRSTTYMKTDRSIRNAMNYYITTLIPGLNLKLPECTLSSDFTLSEIEIERLCGEGISAAKKITWLETFLKEILKSNVKIPATVVKKCRVKARKFAKKTTTDYDEHRICKRELELLYKESCKDPFNALFFLTLLTTGMRIGGFVRIKTKDIATFEDGKYTINRQGQTLEKNNKIFTFLVNPKVKDLLLKWLTSLRPTDPSPYLFPGRVGDGHISIATVHTRFVKMCKNLGFKGKQYHLHSLRHCFSHILLELGNSAEVISKLINHSNVETTRRYYLKESCADVANRCNIPWLKTTQRKIKDPVPNFLKPKKRRKKQVSKLKLFDTCQT